MRQLPLPALVAALVLALVSACRSTGSHASESAPASGPPVPAETVRDAQPGASGAQPEPAASKGGQSGPARSAKSGSASGTSGGELARGGSAPVAPAHDASQQPVGASQHAPAANRDTHGPPDVQQYIANLQSDARVADLRVDVVLEKLHLPPDALVGDLGCGPGVFTLAFAKACPDGVVFASDIEPAQLDVVRARIRETNRRNIVPVLASSDDPHFPPGLLDVVFVADTYHHLEDRVSYMRRVGKALKPGGRLVVLEYKPGPLKVGPPPDHKLPAGVMEKELAEAGWKLVDRHDTHPDHDFEVWRLVLPWER